MDRRILFESSYTDDENGSVTYYFSAPVELLPGSYPEADSTMLSIETPLRYPSYGLVEGSPVRDGECYDWREMNLPRDEVDALVALAIREEQARQLINEAIQQGVLAEGRNGGVLVFKEFEDGSEGWAEVDKRFAAHDLVKQNMVDYLREAINNHSGNRSLEEQIQTASDNVADPIATEPLEKEAAPER